MSETITIQPTTQTTQPQRVRSPDRIRDAFLQLALIIDGESQFDVSLLRDALNQSELTPQDRAELVRLVSSTDLFSHLPDLGDRVATFVVNPQTGSAINANSTASHRRETTRLAQQWDAAILAARESEYLQSQGIVNSNGEFVYRTLKGARFPRMVPHSEVMKNRDPQRVGSYTLLTDFSSWSAEPNRYTYDDPENGDYSTSAAESGKVYTPTPFQIECEHNVIPLSPHAHDRMMKYGYTDSSVKLATKILSAQVSSGRTVPLPMKERSDKKLRSAEYRLTLEVNDAKVIIDNDKVLPVKLVISCFATPKVNGRTVLLSEFITQSTVPLKIVNARFITIIPQESISGLHGVRCTGMPVIPFHVNNDVSHAAVAIIPSQVDARAPSFLADSFNLLLSETDQWLNIRHKVIMDFANEKRRLRENLENGNFMRITESGVEFADVEHLKSINKALYDKIEQLGYILLALILKNNGFNNRYDSTNAREDVRQFLENNIGPSIVHSEEIRSPFENLSNTKPVDVSLIITRMTLSLYLIVGIGDKLVHQPLNGNTLPQSHHLINQKRAEAMLIPASVMRDQLIVYSISGSVGRLLKEVSKELLQTSGLKTILDKSYDHHAKLNIIEQASVQAAFAVTAPIIEISSIGQRRDLSLLAPSGIEYDVSPIVEEIISKLDSQLIRLVQPRAVCAWHPLFAIVVSVMPSKHKRPKYHAIVMPARRKSSIATSYHNVGDSLRSVDFNDNVRAHYGLLREEKGFLSGLLTYLSVFAR